MVKIQTSPKLKWEGKQDESEGAGLPVKVNPAPVGAPEFSGASTLK